jgi:hypothetical protein
METAEGRWYRLLKHWQPIKEKFTKEELLAPDDPLFPLFSYLYDETEIIYKKVGFRRNGESAFLHPLNIVHFLRRAKIKDPITLCVGLVHDLVEEEVDLHKNTKGIKEDKNGIKILDTYRKKRCEMFEEKLIIFCKKKNVPENVVPQIIDTVELLTRHKRDYYYKSIANIYTSQNKQVQERAIEVKLADRTHNVLCIDTFNERDRLHQCFKNLFILNNTKQYLISRFGETRSAKLQFPPIERLFNKCCKATYDACLTICRISHKQGIGHIRSMLQLTLKKFVLARRGIWEVTKVDKKNIHPIRLFHGIVLKYDFRLRHDFVRFNARTKDEFSYCKKFFENEQFTDKQIQAVLDYKDAYALKEVIARLLYDHEYVLRGFLSSTLDKKGMIKR